MWSTATIARLTQILIFLNVFLVQTIFRKREFGSTSMDFQIIIKLGLWALTFGFCMVFFRQWGHKLFQRGNVWLLPLYALMALSCVYAPVPAYSAGCVLSVFAIIAVVTMGATILPPERLLRTAIRAMSAIALASIVVYIVNPSFGRMGEWVDGKLVPSWRMTGIIGTANNVGYIAGFALLLLYILRTYVNRSLFKFFVFHGGINILSLLLSNSRTAIAAVAFSVGTVMFMRFTFLRLAIVFLGTAMLMLAVSLIDFNKLFSLLSRSGDATEILTGTGRTEMWGVSLDYILQKPWFGWGYASTPYIMQNFTSALGHTATHTHNAFLQAWFTIGLFGFLLYLLFVVAKIIHSIRAKDAPKMILMLYLLFTSVTEPSVFQGVATMPVFVWAMIIGFDLPFSGAKQVARRFNRRVGTPVTQPA